MTPCIAHHLDFLYGPDAAASVAPRISDLINSSTGSRQHSPDEPVRPALTQRDTLLITYADQIMEPGVPPLQTLAAFCGAHLADAVSGIHLLPFYPWSSDDGFSVKDYLQVAPENGNWADLQRLGQRFDLMFDGVFNHLSVQSDWFQRFLADDPGYQHFFVTVTGDPDLSRVVRPRTLPLLTECQTVNGPKKVWTTFSADQADLNFQNPEVLLRVLETLLFYVRKGARFIRLDAIAFLWKEIGTPCLHLPQTHHIIQLLRAVLDEAAPHVLLVTETNVPHQDNISYFGDGTNEAQLVYNFALPPLVLHAFATGDAEKLTRWAQSLALPSDRVTFFNFLASHDGIGLNPARGILTDEDIGALVDRTLAHGGFVSRKRMPDGSQAPYEMNINLLDALSDPSTGEPDELAARKLLTAHAILLSLQGVPGLYFHSLFGSRGDRAGAEVSGIPRRINREKLDRTKLECDLKTPGSMRTRIFSGFQELLRARRTCPAFHPQGRQEALTVDKHVFAVLRHSPDTTECALCLHNVGNSPVSVTLHETAWTWTSLLRSQPEAPPARPGTTTIQLGPHQTVWLHSERKGL